MYVPSVTATVRVVIVSMGGSVGELQSPILQKCFSSSDPLHCRSHDIRLF